MARTIDAIYQSIILEKMNMNTLKTKLLNENGTNTLSTEQDLLTSLTTNSRVSIWKLMFYVVAVSIWSLESLWDLFKTEIEALKAVAEAGTLLWWVDKAKAFQYGDILRIDSETFAAGYDTIDSSKQIIEYAAGIENDRVLTLKVRRKDTDILSTSEYDAFSAYVSQIRFAGTKVVIFNLNPDDLKLYYTIYYDPIVGIETLKSNVETAVNDYINNIPFNSELSLSELSDKIQLVTGVKAVTKDDAYGKNGLAEYVQFSNYYQSVAGYNKIDNAFPLSSTFTYIQKY